MKMKITIKEITIIATYIAFITISAFIKIPFFPTPLTLQPLMIFLCGLFFRPKLAFLTVSLYLLLGLLGFPIFAHGGGINYIFQPTFGYLIGFLVAATVISLLVHHTSARKNWYFFYCLLGAFIIHTLGIIYLQFILIFTTKQPLHVSNLLLTFVIFAPKDIFSCFVATFLYFKIPLRHQNIFSPKR